MPVRVLPVLEGEVSGCYGYEDEDEEEEMGNDFVGTGLHGTLFGEEVEDGRSFDFEVRHP